MISRLRRLCAGLWVVLVSALLWPSSGGAFGEATAVDIRMVLAAKLSPARPTAARRLAWEVRQRTSVETRLEPTRTRFDDPGIFESPLLYFSGDREFQPLSEAEIAGLRRFVEFGGFVLIDDAAPDRDGFDRSVRRELGRAFGDGALRPLANSHTVFRSFYLLERPQGRVEGPAQLEAVQRAGRAAVIYSRHDLGGAWDRDDLGNYLHPVQPGGNRQRELAIRLGVNLVLYALCLDYKDDQVHSPFIMRRRGGQ
ncbi:MAG: DUF4159 domain-containing protein [Myxococcales bacterium]|nr:DUF4159 domain-containing protein [Myxococcales bacterium]